MKHFILLFSVLIALSNNALAQNCTLPIELQNGLVGYWPFCGNANDESGNGNDGVVNGATLTADRDGNANAAYSFNGVNNDITMPNALDPVIGNEMTVSLWYNMQDNIDHQSLFLRQGADFTKTWILHMDGSNSFRCYNENGAYSDIVPSFSVYNDWQQLTAVFIDSTIKTYINGVLITEQNVGYPLSWSSEPIILGGTEGTGNASYPFLGLLDDVAIWNRALTQEEVTQLAGGSPVVSGCTSTNACNYNALATTDDGSCTFAGDACDDGNAATTNDILGADCGCAGTAVELGTPHTCGADFVHNPSLTYGSMTDQEGNVYKTIVIGEQEWMAENLNTSIYQNGDTITNVTNTADWTAGATGAWAYYENNAQFDCPYGKLYNWYAATDSRNVCPSGWHVPSKEEWTILSNVFGGDEVSGGKLKSTLTPYWYAPNEGATNESGFSALPGGIRYFDGQFLSNQGIGWWWTSTPVDETWAYQRTMRHFDSQNLEQSDDKRMGYSIRCVRDNNTGLIPGCTDPLANNYNPQATINEGCEYTSSNDTLFCNEITTPLGPGLDWAFWIEGLSNMGLASSDYYEWTNWPSLVFSDNGQAHLTGDISEINNPSNGWHVDMTFYEGMSWAEWSSGGGTYMDALELNTENHQSWSFYKLSPVNSRLDGFGDFSGDQLFLSHQPANYTYGFQFGLGANNRNLDNGGYGMFFYSGQINGQNVSSHGDLTLSMDCSTTNIWEATILVYNDLNGNGEHEADEPGLSNWPVLGNDINGLVWTNSNGNVFLPLAAGQYEFTVLNPTDNWINTTPTSSIASLGSSCTDQNGILIQCPLSLSTVAFGLQVIPGEAIVAVGPYQGFADIIHCTDGYESGVYLENIGSQTVSGFMTLSCDPLFTPGADSYLTTPPIETGPGYALWNLEDFNPGEFELLTFHIAGPGVEYLNQSFTFDFDLTLLDPQGNMIYNDGWSVTPIVACAYDPNDLTGYPEDLTAPHEEGYTIEHFIHDDHVVEFRVRFQNTGTLPAEDIDIYIPIDPNVWELNSIEPLMRVADMQTICLHDDGSVDLNILEHELPEGVEAIDLLIFSFDDIFLPDSASDPDGSQGYVWFQMKAKHELDPGTELNAQAFIYFEQNPPIATNETYHVIFDCTSFTPMTGDAELCADEDLLFSASQPYVDEYAWSLNGLEGSNNIFIYEGIEAGDYTLQLNTSNVLCPLGEDHEVNITVHELPTLDLPLDATVCEGESITFEANSDEIVSWSNGANTGDSIEATESFTVTATSVGAGGCSVSEDWLVTVNPAPSAAVDTANYVLTATDGTQWQWSVDGVVTATTQSITATENGNYSVVVTNEFGCEATSEIFDITLPTFIFEHSWLTLNAYPNPMKDQARLELPKGVFDIALYDMTGACVRAMQNQQGVAIIERESLASGVYQVRITQGGHSTSVRLVIE